MTYEKYNNLINHRFNAKTGEIDLELRLILGGLWIILLIGGQEQGAIVLPFITGAIIKEHREGIGGTNGLGGVFPNAEVIRAGIDNTGTGDADKT